MALPARPAEGGDRGHLVEFYETEGLLIDAVSAFAGSALRDGDAAIVIAAATHRRAFEAAISVSGIDVAAAVDADGYLAVDAADLLEEGARRLLRELGVACEFMMGRCGFLTATSSPRS